MQSKAQEEKALRRLRLMTDITCQTLAKGSTTLTEAYNLIFHVRRQALSLFPDKADTFDMIYGRRFHRILEEKGELFSIAYPFWN
ncbi:MAG: hypothetical protein MAGBODY4_00687 [Candidatus Marinimicrobia bacterium]|nr:hypothetical protein [Candidatus Neomarinimicrobiota bacterium]